MTDVFSKLIKSRQPSGRRPGAGFTIMEIVVATTVFAVVVSSLLALFNYTLKINRRTEALRQAAQGMQSFVEFMAKEIRNGRVDYGITKATVVTDTWVNRKLDPCDTPQPQVGQDLYNSGANNKLAITNDDGSEECFYFGDSSGNYWSNSNPSHPNQCTTPLGAGQDCTLVIKKTTVSSPQILNPANFRIDKLAFYIRPICDPFTASCSGGLPKTQPFVTMVISFVVQLPTGEQQVINYQTTVSTNKYDLPNS